MHRKKLYAKGVNYRIGMTWRESCVCVANMFWTILRVSWIYFFSRTINGADFKKPGQRQWNKSNWKKFTKCNHMPVYSTIPPVCGNMWVQVDQVRYSIWVGCELIDTIPGMGIKLGIKLIPIPGNGRWFTHIPTWQVIKIWYLEFGIALSFS